MERVIVIYGRYSSDMQNPKSCDDQVRDVRDGLSRMQIPTAEAIVIHDHAESGTKTDRSGYEQLQAVIQQHHNVLVAVDDQSRLSRSDNAFAFIQDLVYVGGRFISTGEGIDTAQHGWELRVKVMELHNSTTIRELGRRVRRGMLGRVLRGLSAGDLTFGYESYLLNPDAPVTARGPKPERGIRINQTQTEWVRKIFEWFLACWSVREIAAELTRQGVKRLKGRGQAWTTQQVRSILRNPKYIGVWHWGRTRTLRNSFGKKKQDCVPVDQQVQIERPELRIIDQETWDRTQQKLREILAIYGARKGQKRRGPRVHHTAAYPTSLLGGLLYCENCGGRLWDARSHSREYYACHNVGKCKMRTMVPRGKAEQALLEFVANLLQSYPEWVQQVAAEMRRYLKEISTQIPDELAAKRKRLHELQSGIERLVDALASGGESDAIRTRLQDDEGAASQLRVEIAEAERLLAVPLQMPDDHFIAEQMKALPDLLRSNTRESALLLRKLLGKVLVSSTSIPSRKRGVPLLRFEIDAWQALMAALEDKSLTTVPSLFNATPTSSGQFEIVIGGPNRMQAWGPKIAELRAGGVSWKEISKISGLKCGSAYIAWKQYRDSQAVNDRQVPDGDDNPQAA